MEVWIETKRLYIRGISEQDIDHYCAIQTEINGTGLGELLTQTEYAETTKSVLWKELNQKDRFNTLIFLKETDNLCGQVCMQHTDANTPEIGIDILPEYQNHGYGPEAILTFAGWYSKIYGIQQIKVCIAEGNNHSRHVFKKLGAEYIGALPVFTEAYLKMVRQALPGADISELEEAKVDTYILRVENSNS